MRAMINLIHKGLGDAPVAAGGRTCRERELQLLLHNLQGNEVMLLVEAAIVEQQGVPVLGGKPVGERHVTQMKDPRATKIHRGDTASQGSEPREPWFRGETAQQFYHEMLVARQT